MVAYKFKLVGHEMRAQLNVKNLFDKRYREGADGYFAPARTINLSLAMKF